MRGLRGRHPGGHRRQLSFSGMMIVLLHFSREGVSIDLAVMESLWVTNLEGCENDMFLADHTDDYRALLDSFLSIFDLEYPALW